MVKNLDEVFNKAKEYTTQKVSVAAAEDKEVLIALKEAAENEICEPILVGDEKKIKEIADELNFDVSSYKIINESEPAKASQMAVKLVNQGEADTVMKGHVQTRDLLKAVLDKENGLRTGNILSHIAILDVPEYDKLLFLTDAAMNIAPDLDQKVNIVQNSVDIANDMNIEKPKVAPLAAVEVVNPDMEATKEAALLSKMADRGQIKNAHVDGPLALDNAISKEAAAQKKIDSPVAGDADILLVPDIEAGNILYKSLTHLAKGQIAGIIAGAKTPVILTSRADPHEAKVYSIAAACMMMANRK
ncbi:phosphate butyryltransferase [Natranaerobius thermophilus]|uniref:Phosphate butyryltransferase n=1 Tax=Natranaerobius thermophilus (strain ATCC BAA-1301 / DSM 18059 / JW/NM-WN-LF) TaxID=457570 RepID=B2A514_NATTJ|nr:phosphate butyryltransferase [Natranaerobius thermophilus]ACB85256.1 phosphate butyryltransferase [Natranaerobius thermophilus JW/NM-WN-LF]